MREETKRHIVTIMTSIPLLMVLVQVVSAQAFSTEDGLVEFTSSVPLHTFTGRSSNLVGMINPADSTVDFFLDLTTLKTGIGKRDKDMRLTLNTKEFPFAEFYGNLESPFSLSDSSKQTAIVTGRFTVHGVSHDVTIEGSLQYVEHTLHLLASWDVNLKDYEIVPPRLLFMKVDEKQKIRIDAILRTEHE